MGNKKSGAEIIRLAKPMKKGFLRLIFSRFLIILSLLLLQIGIGLGFFWWITEYVPYLHIFRVLFTVAMVIYLFNNSMDSTAKLTWMFLIALAPIPGAAFLLFTQTDIGHRVLKRRVEELIAETKSLLVQPDGVREELEQDGSGTDDIGTYLKLSGSFPIYRNAEAVYFPEGEDAFAALLEELRKAEHYIFLEFFLIEEGYMWSEVLKILIEKAQAGVDVRVLYDGLSEFFTLPKNYYRLLEQHGIKAKAFAPIYPFVSSRYNYRDHRKIVVIDGKTAFTGGFNLADEYINRIVRFGHWKDTSVLIRGSAVKSFTLMFLQMWAVDEEGEKKSEFLPFLEEPDDTADAADGYVIPYSDCPLDSEKVGETVYMDILNRATDYVHIMTPYLILDGEMQASLEYAAKRGVDVKLILPGIPDKKMAYALAKSHYQALIDSGVHIYEYTPGFVHGKVFVSDGCKAVVGTINLDYRSLYHHFECAAYLYRCRCISDIEKDFQETLGKCREVTPETIAHEKRFYKVMGRLMKFVAPLM